MAGQEGQICDISDFVFVLFMNWKVPKPDECMILISEGVDSSEHCPDSKNLSE